MSFVRFVLNLCVLRKTSTTQPGFEPATLANRRKKYFFVKKMDIWHIRAPGGPRSGPFFFIAAPKFYPRQKDPKRVLSACMRAHGGWFQNRPFGGLRTPKSEIRRVSGNPVRMESIFSFQAGGAGGASRKRFHLGPFGNLDFRNLGPFGNLDFSSM